MASRSNHSVTRDERQPRWVGRRRSGTLPLVRRASVELIGPTPTNSTIVDFVSRGLTKSTIVPGRRRPQPPYPAAVPSSASSARSTSPAVVYRWNEKRSRSPWSANITPAARSRSAAPGAGGIDTIAEAPGRQPYAGAEAVGQRDVVLVDRLDPHALEQLERARLAHPGEPRGRDVVPARARRQAQRPAVGRGRRLGGEPARHVRRQALGRLRPDRHERAAARPEQPLVRPAREEVEPRGVERQPAARLRGVDERGHAASRRSRRGRRTARPRTAPR